MTFSRTMIALLAASVLTPFAAQAATPDKAYKAPRASDGHASLEGNWTNATVTRLEREAAYGDRLVMTDAERAKIEGDTDARNARQNKNTDKATIENWKADALKPDTSDECRSGSRGAACGYNAGWTDPGDRVMRVRGEPRTSLITYPVDGRIPPRKGGALAAGRGAPRGGGEGGEGGEGDNRPARPGQNDNPETRSLGERCIMSFGTSSGPVMGSQLYNNTYQFIQTKDTVAIWVEMVHDVRMVRIGGTHRTDGVRPWMGDSIGHWEGDTLVVDTINYNPQQGVRGSDQNLHVIEKFTRDAPDRLLYQFRVEDPTVWAQPWGGEYEFAASKGGVYEYACHEGNYGLEGILAGARAEEAATRTAQAGPQPAAAR
jgi:hypothetical protein